MNSRSHCKVTGPPDSVATGFSLIELLVVIAIVGVLSAFAVMGFQQITSSRGVTQASADMVSLLEYARNEAINRQSYVWVAIQEVTNMGSLEIQMAAAYSADGSTAQGTNLVPLSRVITARKAGLVHFSSLKESTRGLLGRSSRVEDISTNTAGVIFTNLPTAKFSGRTTITFTPQGEAMLKGTPSTTDGFDPVIGIGIAPARGTLKTADSDGAGVVVDGSSGIVRTLRL